MGLYDRTADGEPMPIPSALVVKNGSKIFSVSVMPTP